MGIVHQIKNVTGGYTSSQKLVRSITSNDEAMPDKSEIREVSELTYDEHEMLLIMDVLDKRLNDKGKYWRHVYKALVLLDYLVRFGSDKVIRWCHQNIYVIKTLREFHYRDESGREVGGDIRNYAREITSLIRDETRLADARSRRKSRSTPRRYRRESPTNSRRDGDDELQRALELSKQTAAQEDERRRMAGRSFESNDLQSAYDISQQNEHELLMAQQRQAMEDAALQQAQAEYLATQQQAQAEAQRLYEMQQMQQLQMQQLQMQQLQMQNQQQHQLQSMSTLQQEPAEVQQPFKTGSNNPFAAFNAQKQAEADRLAHANTIQATNQATASQADSQAPPPLRRRKSNFDQAHLDRLDQILSLDAPTDTFGNRGISKIPAQHTQNTGFVNSSGMGMTQTLTARKTGMSSNPFVPSDSAKPQYTGIAATQMQPAHTGYGFGNANHSNPNLIDL